MKHLLIFCVSGVLFLVLAVTAYSSAYEARGLSLSDMQVKVTSQGHTATFQLYDTVAAKELYDQLPLELDLSNFRDAQWMFYPP